MLAQKPFVASPPPRRTRPRSSLRVRVRHRAGSRAAGRTGSGCRWSPGSRRARAGPGCRRRAGRCCRAAAAGSRRRGCTARRRCAGSSRRCRRTRVVRSRPGVLGHQLGRPARTASGGTPQTCSTISGVYRAKCRLSTWNTHRGCCSVSSRSGVPVAPRRRRSRAPRRGPPGGPATLGPWRPVLGLLGGPGRRPRPAPRRPRTARCRVVDAVLAVQAGEHPVQVLGVGEVLGRGSSAALV